MADAEGLGLIKLGIVCLAVSFLFCDVCCQPGEEFFPLGGFKKLFTGTKEDYLQMESQLEYVKSVAVKTFQTEHGDIIDCIPFDKQPALNHPALRGHVIQKRPSFIPGGLVEKVEQPTDTEPIKQPSKTETEAQACATVVGAMIETIFPRFRDEGCPKGTVPIVRRPILESLRKQYAGQGEGSAEQVHGKGKGSISEALPLGGKKLFTGTKEDYLQMESQLEYVKSVAVKTFQTEHGDIIDCVPLDKLPALRGHVIQKRLSFIPGGLVEMVEQPTDIEPIKQPSKTETEAQACSLVVGAMIRTIFTGFHDEGCPEGTVPIARRAIFESLRKQYAGQGESAEQVHEKGKGSTSEARDEGDHPIAYGYKTSDSSMVDGNGLGQASRKLFPGGIL